MEISYASSSYYVSPMGNDSNNGTSPSSPWQTLNKVNLRRFNQGDKILFERGGEWYGQLNVPGSGITISAYGSGNKPVIHGWKTLTGWINEGGGLYSITNKNLLETARILKINGEVRNKGRFPKDEWHPITKAENNYSIYSDLLSGSPNYTGAEIICNKNDWVIEPGNITSHNGGTITYKGTSHYSQSPNHGFFIQQHINCLTQFGDWMYDGNAKKLTMYFGAENPDRYIVKVSSVEDVVLVNRKSDVVIKNLSIQGSNSSGIRFNGSPTQNNLIQDCEILFSGLNGIYLDPSAGWPEHITIDGCLFMDTKLSGIDTRDSYHVTVTNSAFIRTYLDPGSSVYGDPAGNPIRLGNGYRNGYFNIVGNRIYYCGATGINFRGSHILIEKNIIYKYGLTNVDVGGIKCIGDQETIRIPKEPYHKHEDRIVRKNIVINPDFVPPLLSGSDFIMGIYFDDLSPNIIFEDNIVIQGGYGFYSCSNIGIELRGNIFYKLNKSAVQFHDDNKLQHMSGIDFQNNIVYAHNEGCITFNTGYGNPENYGIFDKNYYIKPRGGELVQTHKMWSNRIYYDNLPDWRAAHGHDLNTKASPTQSTVSELYFNPNRTGNIEVDIGNNRIDISGNPITNRIVTLAPFEYILVLEGESNTEPIDLKNLEYELENETKPVTKPEPESEDETETKILLNIFPNPNAGIFRLEVKLQHYDQQVEIYVFDSSGIMVFQSRENPTEEYLEKDMNLSFLPKGRYIINAIGGNTRVGKQFILQ